MKVISISLAVIMVMCAVWSSSSGVTEAAPNPMFLQKLFGYNSYSGGGGGGYGYYNGGGGYNQGYSGGRRQKQGRSYGQICRVVNSDNYAHPGARVFPNQPFCPYNS